jgi:hypothetical protein
MAANSSSHDTVTVPLQYPTSVIYIDESGSRASASSFFVIAAAKIRRHGEFARAVRGVRDRHDFNREFKFSAITRTSLPVYYDLIDEIEKTDLTLGACVVDRTVFNAFAGGTPAWRVHADVTSQLLVGCINRRELVSILLDGISTPQGISLEDEVRSKVNRRLKNAVVVTAACLDSKSSDGLQVADLLAGAVAFERRRLAGESGTNNSHKAKVASRLRTALEATTFEDVREGRANIATFRRRSTQATLPLGGLQIVAPTRAS